MISFVTTELPNRLPADEDWLRIPIDSEVRLGELIIIDINGEGKCFKVRQILRHGVKIFYWVVVWELQVAPRKRESNKLRIRYNEAGS